MDFKELKEIVINEWNISLTGEGFKASDRSSGLTYIRGTDGIKDIITIQLSDYGVKHYMYNPGASKRFDLIEEILYNVIGTPDEDKDLSTIHAFDEYDGSLDTYLPTPLDPITTKEEAIDAINKFRIYVDKFVLPFFNKYPSIKEIDSKIEKLAGVDWHRFIGYEVVGRRMVIMKLAENPGYDNYVNMILNYFKEESDKGDKEAKADLEKYSKLNEYLKENY